MVSKRQALASLLVILVLLVSTIPPALADDFPSPVSIKSTGTGIKFGHGRDKITLRIDLTYEITQGKKTDQVTVKWNPKKSILSRAPASRKERWADEGFCFDFDVKFSETRMKFDVVAGKDLDVSIVVNADKYLGGYTWKSGNMYLSLGDIFEAVPDAKLDGNTITFSMTKGQVIDPLVWYDEALGLYKYDSILDYTPGMWTNGSTYVELGGVAYQNVYDWLIQTKANYVTGGSYAQWDFTLVNTQEENEPSLTDNQTGSFSLCLVDEAGDGFWTVYQKGTGSFNISVSNTTKTVKGTTAVNATLMPGIYYDVGVKHEFSPVLDVSPYTFICVWVWNDVKNDDNLRVYLYKGIGEAIIYDHPFDWTGWARLVFPLYSPTQVDGIIQDVLSSIISIAIYHNDATVANTFIVDRVTFETAIPCPVEIGVPDDTTQVKLYGYDGSDYWEYMRWELNGSTYSWINPGALYWNGSNPAAAGRLAKQAAWGNYTWSGPPAGATKAPTQAAQYALNLSYWDYDLTRLMLHADYVNDEFQEWNPKFANEVGTPWDNRNSAAYTGKIGNTLVNNGANINFHRTLDYALNAYVNPARSDYPIRYNWQHDSSSNVYSFEFYVDNDNATPQNATLEMTIPDNVTTWRLGYWNGTDYVTFIDYGSTLVLPPQSINGTPLEAVFYFNGFRGETKNPVNATAGLAGIGPVTYSNNYGVMNRAAFTIALGADDGDAAGPDGADEAKLKVTVVYGDSGRATYEFEDSTNQYYGLQSITGNMAFLFNPFAAQPSDYLGILFEEKPTALFITADENETITALEFNVTGDWTVIDSGYNTSATITAVTGETISKLSEYTGYYPDHGYYSRNETGAPGSVEGSTLIPATHVYQKPAGTRYAVAAKIPLPPYGNGTAELSKAPPRVKVYVPAGAHYTARADLASPANSLWVATLFCDFFKNSYNVKPALPMKNSTVSLVDPRTGTNYTFSYSADPKLSASARMYIKTLTVNGTSIPSMVVPVGYVTSGKKITVSATLGYPTTPMLYSVALCNLTAVTVDGISGGEANWVMKITTNSTTTGTVQVYTPKAPKMVKGASSWYYNASTKLVTMTIPHSSPTTTTIYWSAVAAPFSSAREVWVSFMFIISILYLFAEIRRVTEGDLSGDEGIMGGYSGAIIRWAVGTTVFVLLLRVLEVL